MLALYFVNENTYPTTLEFIRPDCDVQPQYTYVSSSGSSACISGLGRGAQTTPYFILIQGHRNMHISIHSAQRTNDEMKEE